MLYRGYQQLKKSYKLALKNHPVCVQSGQAGILMGFGDFISQKYFEGRSFKKIEWKRTAIFIGLGLFYVGPTLTTWYMFLDKKLHHGTLLITLKKVVVDQLIFAPPFISSIMILHGMLKGMPLETNVERLRKDIKDVILMNYSLWPTVQLFNFYYIPVHYQVLTAQLVALCWNTYLSWKFNG